MKKLFFIIMLLVASMSNGYGWGRLGHEVIVAVAQRHLTEKTKENIARYIPYDLKQDALWMDIHRKDKDIAYTTYWHTCSYDSNFRYSPNLRKALPNGDVVRALRVVDDNFREQGYKYLADSVVVFNLRMLIHFVGDVHCAVHSKYPGVGAKGNREMAGKKYDSFHQIYDMIPSLIWGDATADYVAQQIDNASRRERKKVVSGGLQEWLHDIAVRNYEIYRWNSHKSVVLRDDTVELSTELTNIQMRNAGYRLAYLLNLYFGE